MPTLLNDDQLSSGLGSLPGWAVQGGEITKTYGFPAYLDGARFVSQVAELAEAANHHPDLLLRWRKVTVTLSTHSAGGLTEKDLDLASKVEALRAGKVTHSD